MNKPITLMQRLTIAAISAFATPAFASCPELLEHSMKRLHSAEQVNLCEQFSGKPMMIVNTASHCGFTYQFESLEAIHQRYSDKGIGFLGVTSNSFRQAASSEEKAASVCFINYGVSFTMLAPVDVTGSDAHPLFRQLSRQAGEPGWNFNKYIVDGNGQVIKRFGATVKPDDRRITDLLDRLANDSDGS